MKTKSLRKLLTGYGATSLSYCMFSITIAFVLEHILRIFMPDLPACAISMVAALTVIIVLIKRLNNATVREYNKQLAQDAYDLTEQLKHNKNIDRDVLKDLLTEIRNDTDLKND